jgi:2-oxoglutarate ferredoxin oxidoreductase subunit alpha
MIDKRMKKLDSLTKELEERRIETTKLYGPEKAEATIVAWGSTKGPIREAMKLLDREKIAVNYLQIIYLLPFPTAQVEKTLKETEKTIVVENNKTSQLSGLIREHTLKDVDHRILKYDGRPFNPVYLSERIKEAL